jgi:hypothetical protein
MTQTAQTQSAAWRIRKRNRSARFAQALTVHAPGLVVIGADQFNGNLQTGAMFCVSEVDGVTPFVALTSGTTGPTALTGNGVVNDGGVTWQMWSGAILSPPATPA